MQIRANFKLPFNYFLFQHIHPNDVLEHGSTASQVDRT